MVAEPPRIVRDLRRKTIITDREISAAVDIYLADPKTEPYRFGSDHVLDVAAAVEAHRPAKAAVAEKGMKVALRRMMVRTAVILACPVQR